MTRPIIVIPARYASSRFPGKPLVDILGKTLIHRVWNQCVQTLPVESVFIATDDSRIKTHCEEFGARVVMTSVACLTGTDRVYDAARQLNAPLVINVQGDEPTIRPSDIMKVVDAFLKDPEIVHCGMAEIMDSRDFFSVNTPKVVCDSKGTLLYMSRAPIPGSKSKEFPKSYKQVCAYGFTLSTLQAFAQHGRKTPLEAIEDIEILRFLELGYKVKMIEVSGASIAVDTPADVARLEKFLSGVN